MIRKLDDDLPVGPGAGDGAPLGWTGVIASESEREAGRGSPLAESARLVLEIAPGERPLLPDFGCRIHSLPALETRSEKQLAAALVEEALERWLPQLGVDGAEVVASEERLIQLRLWARGTCHPLTIVHRPPQAGAPPEVEKP